jgi:hypothetical protein
MFIIFLPGLLLFKLGEPEEDERGKLIRPFVGAELFELPSKQLFLPLFSQITEMYAGLDEGQTMVSPLQLGSMLVDWTDPDKAVYVLFSYGRAHSLTS